MADTTYNWQQFFNKTTAEQYGWDMRYPSRTGYQPNSWHMPQQDSTKVITDGLTGANRDVAIAILNVMKQYGLETLAPKIVEFVKQGYSADTITLLLQDTKEYKTRFAANETRIKKGLPILTPAEYIAAENSYRQIMVSAGLPAGFYDTPNDFKSFIERDIAPQEVQGRVNTVRQFLDKADPNELAMMKQFYTTGDLIAYALDPNRAAPLVGKAFNAAAVAGQARAQGIGIGKSEAESLAGLGVDGQQAMQGFSLIANEQDNAKKLAGIDNVSLTTQDLIDETFRADADAAKKRQLLGQREAARFGGSSAIGSGSLGTGKSGSQL